MTEEYDDKEANELFLFLGKYIAFFQWMESKLDQILLLARGEENWTETQYELANMRNSDKISAVEAAVLAPKPFTLKDRRPEWVSYFSELLERIRAEGRRRNSIVHSQYLMDFLEYGMLALKSDRRRINGKIEFQHERLDKERREIIMDELSKLAFELSQGHLQLVNFHTAE